MKKFFLIFICMMVFILTACEKSDQKEGIPDSDKYFDYQIQNAVSFTESEGKIWVSTADSPEVVCYDSMGKEIDKINMGEGEHSNLKIYKNSLFSFTFTEKGPRIHEYHFDTKELTVNELPEDITSATSMAVTEDEIYLIYWKEENGQEDAAGNDEEDDGYVDMGEHAVTIDRHSFQETETGIENVITLCQISDTEIMYYAHDEKAGYYFTVYDTASRTFSDSIENGSLNRIFSFTYDRKNKMLFSTDFSNERLVATGLNGEGKRAELLDHVIASSGNDIVYDGGNCYILDDISHSVIRTDISTLLKNNSELTMYRTMSMENPYGCGYYIHTEMLEEDEFALSVLAGDSDYDMCMMNTSESKAGEMRNKGAFYALNDIPGVSEYLDACHGYIKETATDDNGDIWMLPIAVDIPFLLYNEMVCQKNGISVSDISDYGKLLSVADQLYENLDLRTWYSMNGFQLQQYMINQYNAGVSETKKVTYDSSTFQKICNFMKEHPADSDESLHTWLSDSGNYAEDMESYYSQYVLSLSHYYELDGFDEIPYKMLDAAPLPEIQEGTEKYYGNGTCICVNPRSENLESTLDYISSYCYYMLRRNDTFLFQDAGTIPFPDSRLSKEIHEIYEKGGICFEFPEEIFWDTYFMFQQDQISFPEMAEELKRKVEMYLYE